MNKNNNELPGINIDTYTEIQATADQIAKHVGIKTSDLIDLCDKNLIRGFKVGDTYLIRWNQFFADTKRGKLQNEK